MSSGAPRKFRVEFSALADLVQKSEGGDCCDWNRVRP